jgi:hypothetical protein
MSAMAEMSPEGLDPDRFTPKSFRAIVDNAVSQGEDFFDHQGGFNRPRELAVMTHM